MIKKFVLTIVSSMLIATAAFAETESMTVGTFGNWTVSDNNDGTCGMISTYDHDTMFYLRFNNHTDTLSMTITDPTYRSLKDGETPVLKILIIGDNKKVDDGWGEKKWRVSHLSNGTPALTSAFDGRQMLADLKANRIFGLFYNDKVVESLSLDNITVAINALTKCAVAEARDHPTDLFDQ